MPAMHHRDLDIPAVPGLITGGPGTPSVVSVSTGDITGGPLKSSISMNSIAVPLPVLVAPMVFVRPPTVTVAEPETFPEVVTLAWPPLELETDTLAMATAG